MSAKGWSSKWAYESHQPLWAQHLTITALLLPQDVLVYNFFEDSPLGDKWRLLYNYMASKDMLPGGAEGESSRYSRPAFEPRRQGRIGT